MSKPEPLTAVLDRIQAKTAANAAAAGGQTTAPASTTPAPASADATKIAADKEAAETKEATELKASLDAMGELLARKFVDGVVKQAEALIGSTHPDPTTAWAGRVWSPLAKALADRRGYRAKPADPGIKSTYEDGSFTGRPTKG